MAWSILGVTVQRQIRQQNAKPLGQRSHDRLPLAVAQTKRVQERKRGSRAGLPVGNAGAVVVVVEPKPHKFVQSEHRIVAPARAPSRLCR
jgi:hypothetical protein